MVVVQDKPNTSKKTQALHFFHLFSNGSYMTNRNNNSVHDDSSSNNSNNKHIVTELWEEESTASTKLTGAWDVQPVCGISDAENGWQTGRRLQ